MHLSEVEDVQFAQLGIGLARIAVQRKMIGAGGFADHKHHQRLLLAAGGFGAHHRVFPDGLHYKMLFDAQALLGVLADGVDVIGRVDEMGELVLFTEDRRISRIERAH